MKISNIRNLKKTINGATVLLRVDYNEPIKITSDKKAKVKEDFRIISSLPTISYLIEHGCKIVIMTHLGDEPLKDPDTKYLYSTKILAKKLSSLINKKVSWVDDCLGDKVKNTISNLKEGELLMLENLRFYSGEKENSGDFARNLAGLVLPGNAAKISKNKPKHFDGIYVNDAFSVSHRDHASISGIKKFLPSFAGLLLEKEILNLNMAMHPKKPAVAVMGGSKISTKIKLINKLLSSYDQILIGGAMANNFFKAKGMEVGISLISEDDIDLAKRIKSDKIILPLDVIVGFSRKKKPGIGLKKLNEVKGEDAIFDIGPATIKLFSSYLRNAKTIIWNGPLGKFEEKKFRSGTLAIGRLIASLSSGKAFGVAGGGETIEALRLTKDMGCLDWVSTGGGAMLSYLGGEKMPGLAGLLKK